MEAVVNLDSQRLQQQIPILMFSWQKNANYFFSVQYMIYEFAYAVWTHSTSKTQAVMQPMWISGLIKTRARQIRVRCTSGKQYLVWTCKTFVEIPAQLWNFKCRLQRSKLLRCFWAVNQTQASSVYPPDGWCFQSLETMEKYGKNNKITRQKSLTTQYRQVKK